jgi:hypothetical protein
LHDSGKGAAAGGPDTIKAHLARPICASAWRILGTRWPWTSFDPQCQKRPQCRQRRPAALPDFVSSGSRLCENSNIELACRISVSISSMRKPIALETCVGRRQLRKQFCASLARARFHTASVINGLRTAQPRLPLSPQEQTSSACPSMSVWCQKRRSANRGVTETLRGDSVPASKPDQDACLRTLANSWFG